MRGLEDFGVNVVDEEDDDRSTGILVVLLLLSIKIRKTEQQFTFIFRCFL